MVRWMICAFGALLSLWGCSNEAELPNRYHRGYLAQPANVETGIEDGQVTVSWELAAEDNVTGFVVSFTDSSGSAETRSVEGAEVRTYAESGLDLGPGAVYLIQVWAVDARRFFGPRSAVDTLVVF